MKRVLIVDDVPEIRRLLRICAMHHFEVLEASSAEEALATMQRQPPDLLVLDIGLSGAMDGLELLDLLRRDPRWQHLRVVMLSGRGLLGDGADLPVDAYFTKPFRPLAVIDCIDRLLATPTPSSSTPTEPPTP